MQDKKVPIGIQISSSINEKLNECARAEKRTKRAVVEIALEEHFDRSEEYRKLKAEEK